MDKPFKEILLDERKRREYTQREMADLLGISEKMYSFYENGKYSGGEKKITKYLDILYGKNENNQSFQIANNSNKLIPVYDVEINAGIVELLKESIKENIVGYLDLPEAQDADMVVTVRGDSMATLYNNGDRIAIKFVHDKSQIFYGKPYVVITSELNALKYIRKHSNPDMVILRSENVELYDDFDIEKKAIIHLFKVLCVIKSV